MGAVRDGWFSPRIPYRYRSSEYTTMWMRLGTCYPFNSLKFNHTNENVIYDELNKLDQPKTRDQFKLLLYFEKRILIWL